MTTLIWAVVIIAWVMFYIVTIKKVVNNYRLLKETRKAVTNEATI